MMDDTRFDSRTIERNLAKGVVTRQEYDQHLAGLADVTSDADNVEGSMLDHEPVSTPLPAPNKAGADKPAKKKK